MNKKLFFIAGIFILVPGLFFIFNVSLHNESLKENQFRIVNPHKPEHVRGIHITSWFAGSKKRRQEILKLLNETELNTLVIAIKESDGGVTIPGVELVDKIGSYVSAMPGIEEFVRLLKSNNIYVVARIVVFRDDMLARKKPEFAVKTPGNEIWRDRKGMAWSDPYNKEVWDYNLTVAEHAIDLGFEEIQFDYIRFPSDGDTSLCRYSQNHSSVTSAKALNDFLDLANARLKTLGANISICVFGLTTTRRNDMGIGQNIVEITGKTDFVCPMVYPSHYNKGEYNLPDPNSEPYKTVFVSLSGAKERLGEDYKKLRPYLQDFSLGYKYGPKEVRAQITAAYDNGIYDWTLWDPNCRYTRAALLSNTE